MCCFWSTQCSHNEGLPECGWNTKILVDFKLGCLVKTSQDHPSFEKQFGII